MYNWQVSFNRDHDRWPDGTIESDLDSWEGEGQEEGVNPALPGGEEEGEGEGDAEHEDEAGVKYCQHGDDVPEGGLHIRWGRAENTNGGKVAG